MDGRVGWVKDVFVYVGEGWWKGKNATVAPRREKVLEVAKPTREILMRIARERGRVGSLGCMREWPRGAGAIRGDRKGAESVRRSPEAVVSSFAWEAISAAQRRRKHRIG
jgi:hypothetical protein